MERAAVAFSGGVDSSFLVKVASDVLGKKVLAITLKSPSSPRRDMDRASEFVEKHHVRHVVVESGLEGPNFVNNDRLRCYYCKIGELGKIIEIAKKYNISNVLDGQNWDDISDYRPGTKAAQQLGVRSPLKYCHLSKQEIRILSRQTGLAGWDRPSSACLASRIAYGTKITERLLRIIDKLETFLLDKGFTQVRVRHHGSIARIEVQSKELGKFLDRSLTEDVIREFKNQGYLYVTLDIDGYRMGSMNKLVNK
ncbi:MAG: ATP-dependent sacrificial sulfur transferase LarE [Actinomycetia bacterium]|nr:ATP-dependent sacrificial sulfur transferase LarE [Actinomycetes bacterium]